MKDLNDKWKKILQEEQGSDTELYNIWSNNDILSQIITDLGKVASFKKCDAIVTIQTAGIIFASPLADKYKKPLFIFRKKENNSSKLTPLIEKEIISWKGIRQTLYIDSVEYEIPKKVIIVDDLIQNGSTIKAVIEMTRKYNHIILGIVSIINLMGIEEIDGISINSLIYK